MKNKFVAVVLALFGGVVGLHKFYLRDTGAGVFYVFLTIMTSQVFAVSALLGVIDAVRYLMMPPAEFDRKFNKRYRRTSKVDRRKRRQRETFEERSPQPRSRQTTRERSNKTARNRKTKTTTRVRNNPFKKSGLKKYKEYEIEEAIEDFKKGLKIQPKDVALHFNLACAYSLMENKEEGFKHLDLAVDNGLKDHNKITSHDDLAFLRIQPEFDSFKENGFQVNRKITEEIHEDAPTTGPQNKPMDDLLLAQLNRLMELRKKGVLTEQEFVRERKKVLVR